MVYQSSLLFLGGPRQDLPPQGVVETSPKRGRSDTTNHLPAPRRPRRAPPLKPSNAFLFRGLHPYYNRTICEEKHDMMWVSCSQAGCTNYPRKLVNRSLVGTNNYKSHYQKFHPGIALNKKELKEQEETKKINVLHFQKPESEQTHQERYRNLLLEFTIKNNLSFSLVD
jgi:hypothetical protein